jgi:hypothetical protein
MVRQFAIYPPSPEMGIAYLMNNVSRWKKRFFTMGIEVRR